MSTFNLIESMVIYTGDALYTEGVKEDEIDVNSFYDWRGLRAKSRKYFQKKKMKPNLISSIGTLISNSCANILGCVFRLTFSSENRSPKTIIRFLTFFFFYCHVR